MNHSYFARILINMKNVPHRLIIIKKTKLLKIMLQINQSTSGAVFVTKISADTSRTFSAKRVLTSTSVPAAAKPISTIMICSTWGKRTKVNRIHGSFFTTITFSLTLEVRRSVFSHCAKYGGSATFQIDRLHPFTWYPLLFLALMFSVECFFANLNIGKLLKNSHEVSSLKALSYVIGIKIAIYDS